MELVRATKKETTCGITGLEEIEGLPANLYQYNLAQANGNGDLQCTMHSALITRVGEQFGKSCAAHVDYTMSVVLPAVEELHGVLKAIETADCLTGPKAYRLEQSPATSLFDISDIVEDLEGLRHSRPTGDKNLVLDYTNGLEDEALLDILRSGSSGYDAAVGEFVARVGMPLIREVWKQLFSSERSISNYDGFRVETGSVHETAIATFLFARSLLKGEKEVPVVGTGGLTRAQYKVQLRNLFDWSGVSAALALEAEVNEEKNGILIQRVVGKVVHVNKRVYDRFLSEGGDVEVLLGAAVSSRDRTMTSILENAKTYCEAWEYQVAVEKQNSKKNQLIDTRRAVSDFIRQYVKVNSATDEVIKQNILLIMDNAYKFVEELYQPRLKDLHQLALEALGCTVFSHTDAVCILDSYTRAVQDNPEMSSDKAMTVALSDYLADWVAEMVELA
jgi:hypothetical protein